MRWAVPPLTGVGTAPGRYRLPASRSPAGAGHLGYRPTQITLFGPALTACRATGSGALEITTAVRRAVISPAEQSSRLYVYASPRSG